MNSQKTTAKSVFSKIKDSDILFLVIALIVLCVIMSLTSQVFLSERNIMNMLRQVSLTAVCGFGLTMVILLGEIDLSVGSQQAIAGLCSVVTLNATGSIALAVLAALAAGAGVGALNGFLVAKGKMNSLIVTLGTMTIWRGVAMVTTDAVSIQVAYPDFQVLGTGYVGPIPNGVIIMAVLFVAIWYILRHTTFGRYIYAIGGNQEASKLAGLPVDRMRITVYIISGVLTMLAGVLLASRMSSAQPSAGDGFEMTVIAAIILGGVSLNGGIGGIGGAFIGMLILGVLENGLTLLDVSSFWQNIARGIVIILAVYLDEVRKARLAKKIVQEQKDHLKKEGIAA